MTRTDPAKSGRTMNVGIDGFWPKVRDATNTALLLDYDGTLAPFHVDRLKAIPLDGVVTALQDLSQYTDTYVAIISGRPIAELLTLMPDPGVTIVGTHGFEVRRPGADIVNVDITPTQRELLDRAEADARTIVGVARAERKIATVAAHFRGLDQADARQFEQDLTQRWLGYADLSAVEVRQFNGGLEMRALGRHKGIAVAEYLETCPPGTLAVYIGDDDTDEDAFNVLGDYDGYGIRVGEPVDDTAAQGALRSCDAVLQFLHTWIEERKKS